MTELLYTVLAIVSLALLSALFLGPTFYFHKMQLRCTDLQKRGDIKALYEFQQRLYPLLTTPLLFFWFRDVAGPLLLFLSHQRERTGDSDTALLWAMRVTEPQFMVEHRVQALQYAASLLRRSDRVEDAQKLQDAALALIPNFKDRMGLLDGPTRQTAIAGHARADALLDQGHFTEALQIADRIDDFPDTLGTGMAAILRIKAFRYLGRYDEAIRERQRIASEWEAQRRELTQRKNSNPSVNRMMTTTINQVMESSEVDGVLAIITLCLESGKTDMASEYWQRIPVSVRDSDTALHCNAVGGWLAAAQGDVDKARRLIANAQAELPDYEHSLISIRYAVARTYLALHDYEAARECLQFLLDMRAHTLLIQTEYRMLLAQCYEGLENTDAARSEYEQVIAAGFDEAAFTATARTRLAHYNS